MGSAEGRGDRVPTEERHVAQGRGRRRRHDGRRLCRDARSTIISSWPSATPRAGSLPQPAPRRTPRGAGANPQPPKPRLRSSRNLAEDVIEHQAASGASAQCACRRASGGPNATSRSTRPQSTIDGRPKRCGDTRRRRRLRATAGPSPALRRPPPLAIASLPRQCRDRCASPRTGNSQACCDARSHAKPAAVRAGADPGIVAVAPVSEVVAAFLAAAGVVADLIGRQPGARRSSRRSARTGPRQRRCRAGRTRRRRHARRSACPARSSAGRATGGECRATAPGASVAAQLSSVSPGSA